MEAYVGISAYFHDSAAALIVDGKIIGAAQEERFTRKKHDSTFPSNALRYVLNEGGLKLSDVTSVIFYDKPFLKFERLLETYHSVAPKGFESFLHSIPLWIKEKIFLRKMIEDELSAIGDGKPAVLFSEHHLSHAASAFYPSPFKEAAILTIDGVGEWATTAVFYGEENKISVLKELHFPHSLGLLYSAFTDYCGFKVNSGEYKLMGLAPYGNAGSEETKAFIKNIEDKIIDIREDGSFLLNMEYFNYTAGLTMCREECFEELFGIPRRKREAELTQEYMNLAYAVQAVTGKVVNGLAETAKKLTGSKYLAMAGGVALNCTANGKLLRNKLFDDIWIQPAAGDAGGAVGAAYTGWYIGGGHKRTVMHGRDQMKGTYLGQTFDSLRIESMAEEKQAAYQKIDNFDDLCKQTADYLAEGLIIGWFQGRMEFGPRALGNRSILADPRRPEMKDKLNLIIKQRESFRPFAPSILEEDTETYFDIDRPSPYMVFTVPVKNPPEIPAVTHVDGSARIQTVTKDSNEKFYRLIQTFKEQYGCPLLVNTSFNIRGEPIVCTPLDAYNCFVKTGIDILVIENYIFKKEDQPVLD